MKNIYKVLLIAGVAVSIVLLHNLSVAQNPDNVFMLKGPSQYAPLSNRSKLAKERENVQSVIFTENFEAGIGSWLTTGDWTIGTPAIGPANGHNSVNCAGTFLNGIYLPNANANLKSAQISIPNSPFDIKLSFWEWFNLESCCDLGRVMVTNDAGVTWFTLNSRSGNSGSAWRKTDVLLNQFKGQNIQIQFNLTSDGSVQYDGWFTDDLEISVFQPKPVSATMTNLNSQNFPFIYMNVSVDTNGAGCSNLNQSNFAVYENGTLQTNYFNVTPPNTSGGVRRADIIFLMDNSGSMGPYQSAIANNVNDFLNNLVASNVDFALGLCRYGDGPNNGAPLIEDFGALTSNAEYFKNTLWTRNTVNGGTEPGYYAITQSASGFSFRPGAQKIFIEITDETPNQGGATMNDALDACMNNSITLFALTDSTYLYNDFFPITSPSHGQIYSLLSPFDDILNYISQSISNSYVVQYSSANPVMDGIQRNVEVVVNYMSNADTALGSYTPGAAPQIVLTPATLGYFNQPAANNISLVISANVSDLVAPFITQVDVFYKNTSDSVYKMIQMTQTLPSLIYSAILPSYDIFGPGLDFYITATDGQTTSSLPSVNPASHPFQIAVLPNFAPVIAHTPVLLAAEGLPLEISATITDVTNYISEAKLYYRKVGQLIFQEVNLSLAGSLYSATIPASYVTSDNLDYFIRATDNFNVSAYAGTADNPLRVQMGVGIESLVSSVYLSFNYPNPFTESTAIYYGVRTRSSVVIQIYNITGEIIETLVNTTQERGVYSTAFATKVLASGIYYYSLTETDVASGNVYRENKKLVLVK